MTTTQHIIHELPVPQSIQGLHAACGLPAVTVRHGDQVHQFAYTTQPEYVTCVGCLAVRESTAARAALGEGWLRGGVTLAEGIERKTCALEGLNATPPEITPADPMLPTVAVPRDLVEAIVEDLREGLAIERETGEALAKLLEGGGA